MRELLLVLFGAALSVVLQCVGVLISERRHRQTLRQLEAYQRAARASLDAQPARPVFSHRF